MAIGKIIVWLIVGALLMERTWSRFRWTAGKASNHWTL